MLNRSMRTLDIGKLCKNRKYGCNWKAKKYTCYKRMRYVKKANGPDEITFTNRKRKTQRLKTPMFKVVDWFSCSHFK